MNDELRILSMLLRFSQRRMVAVYDQVLSHVGTTEQVVAALTRLEQGGLVYSEGPTVRLTMAGLATAVAASRPASVHRLGRPRNLRSHAA